MDACHLFLSGPWFFDNHVIHDGHANTFAFKHKGRNLFLTQLPPYEPLKSKPRKRSEKSLHISEKRTEGAISKTNPLFTLW